MQKSTGYHALRTLALSVVSGLAAGLGLMGCGGPSYTYAPFNPARVVVFGDALSVSSGSARYTVNGSGAIDNWTTQVASSYSISTIVATAPAGNALLSALSSQVTNFGGNYQSGDMVLISGGYRDLIDLAQAGGSTASATALGSQYAEVIRAAVSKGAQHVGVVNLHDFSASYAANGGSMAQSSVKALIRAFNDGLSANLGDTSKGAVGDYVRLVNNEYYFNLVLTTPSSYGFTDATTVVCPNAGAGIGFGAKDSSGCTTSNVQTAYASTYNNYVYADPVYWTPAMHRSLGSYAYSVLRARW